MKKTYGYLLRKLTSSGLALVLALSPAVTVFAAEEVTEIPAADSEPAAEVSIESAPQAQTVEVKAANTETKESSEGAETPEQPASADNPATEETPAITASDPQEQDQDTIPVADEGIEEIPPAQTTNEEDTVTKSEENTGETSVPAQTADDAVMSKSSGAGSVMIGDTSFNSDEEETSCWSDGKGWKNIAGQYVAMVDYDGSEKSISADGGVLTLAVAGVNRIGSLTGDCSVRITGTGIVLIDSIDIEDGNTLTLHPNTALYNKGSAAVFLKQEDGSYLLINGDVTGILDEEYSLDNIKLTIPDGSSLYMTASCTRSETWRPEGSEEPVTDVTEYTVSVPEGADYPVHLNGAVDLQKYRSSLLLGKNGVITIDKEASFKLQTISNGFDPVSAELIIQGILDVKGVVEGGLLDVTGSGSLTGEGTVLSAAVNLDSGGKLSEKLLLDNSSLTITGSDMHVSAKIKDSIIYLKGTGIVLDELNVSGSSAVSSGPNDKLYATCKIGDITLDSESNLDFLVNDYSTIYPIRYVKDTIVEIFGKISGGTVSVLAGCVQYTGTQTDTIPVVPFSYASRVFINGIGTDSTYFPLVMTDEETAELLKSDQIPVMNLKIEDTLLSDEIPARKWVVSRMNDLDPLERKDDQYFSCSSFLEAYDLAPSKNEFGDYSTLIEIIRDDLTRECFYYDDPTEFCTDNVIMIRVLDCEGRGGQGGSVITHTKTSITGAGVIGGSGAALAKTGTGKVVYGVAKTPSEDPEPDDDEKENNNNKEKQKDKDTNNNKNKNSNDKKSSNSSGKNDSGKTQSYTSDSNGLVVTISVREPLSEDGSETEMDLPQLWNLDITEAGVPLTDLIGNAVEVAIPFTIPDEWGDPEEIGENDLYAVFVDDKEELTAYRAQYDADTEEVSFETEQTGDFVIVQFKYEEEPFTEDFYKELADLKEIRDILTALKDNVFEN